MFPCGYVKILQPVAICTVIFVTGWGGGHKWRACYEGFVVICKGREHQGVIAKKTR